MAAMHRIHLDTDIGGDTDDLCALALLLASPDVDLVGITTVADTRGGRAALVRHALALAGRTDIPVASGAFGVLGGFPHEATVQGERYWPGLVDSPPTPAGEALDLLLTNASLGATVVAIGPFTNLALAEARRPGVLRTTELVLMGGFVRPMPAGFPPWDASVDYNVQADRVAARIVFERLSPLLVPIEVTVRTAIRRGDLARLRAAGPLAQLVAHQSELYAAENDFLRQAATFPAVPDDLLNFQHDPLACAIAIGWDCASIETIPLLVGERDRSLTLTEDPSGTPFRVVTDVDPDAFASRWLDTVAD